MQYTQIIKLVQSIIQAIQNGNLLVASEIRRIFSKSIDVHVNNPQTEVKVTGKVEVDQSKVQKAIEANGFALRSLKNVFKAFKKIEVSNLKDIKYPEIPKYPEFPKNIKVSNFPEGVRVINWDNLIRAVKDLDQSVEKIKLDPTIDVKAPIVNVPAPIVNVPRQEAPVVNVEAPDMSELSKIMEFLESIGVKRPLAVRLSDGAKFYKALEKMADIYAGSSFSAFQDLTGNEARGMLNKNSELLVTSSDTWALNDTHSVGDINYLGEETVDGKWRVTRATSTGSFVTMRYATTKNNDTVTSYDQAWTDHLTLMYERISQAL